MKKIIKITKRVMFTFTLCVLSFIIFLFLWILIKSPGKIEPYIDSNGNPLPGSLSEKTFVKIGGVEQGMIIRSKNINNPVLLYIHGGPSFPNYFLIDKFNPGLEDFFTVCYWEQRGGGLSYTPDVTLESMTFNQLTSDAIEVTNYLRNRFHKEKIYLMAHSGGSPIALLAAVKEPDLFQAYIAMAQITNQAESEKIAYNYMLNEYEKSGNRSRIAEFKKFPVLESKSSIVDFYKSPIRDQSMHELGIGTMHNIKSVFWDIFIPVWTCKAYTISEKFNIWKSKFSFLPKTNLINELFTFNFSDSIQKLDIPIYFFSGKYDLTVNVDLSRAYFQMLQAPVKGFYLFENSAHSPLFEEPEKVRRIIEHDVLNGKTDLSNSFL